MDEHRQAISFANSYFALVDGLASGLDSHLSEDVVLDWFGRTVRGRKNVSAFLEAHKVNSRHVFSRIAPATGIAYKTKHFDRGNRKARGSAKVQKGGESSPRDAVTLDVNRNEIDAKEISAKDDDTFYYLNEGDLSNLFKLEISSTNTEEIEQCINRIKLEEEVAPSIKAIKRECGQGDGPFLVETSAVKYVEADGRIEFSRKFWKQDAWSAYLLTTSKFHTWRRPCKLQIAYTALTECLAARPPRKSDGAPVKFGQPKVRLPTLEEVNEIGGRLVPNPNAFGGFLKEIDFFEDRRGFLESLQTEMASRDPCTPVLAPRYVQNKLVFDKPRIDATACHDKSRKRFVFNYQIHLIIYEGSNACKKNLSREFETTNV